MTSLVPAGLLAVFALATGYGFVSQRKRQGRMADTETTRAAQVLEGVVELKGTVQARETVADPMYGEDVVFVDWEVEREEQRPDDEGGTETVDHRIAGGRREAIFEVVDESGSVRVDPQSATLKVDSRNRTRESFRGTDTDQLQALEAETGGDQGGTDREGVRVRADGVDSQLYDVSDDRRVYSHEVLRPGDDVYVLGEATRDDEGLIVGKGDDDFLLSNMSEEELAETLGSNQLLLGALAAAFTIGAAYFLLLG